MNPPPCTHILTRSTHLFPCVPTHAFGGVEVAAGVDAHPAVLAGQGQGEEEEEEEEEEGQRSAEGHLWQSNSPRLATGKDSSSRLCLTGKIKKRLNANCRCVNCHR